MTTKPGVALGIVLLLAIPVLAHHPFSAEYDWKRPVTVSGTVTKLDWENPHARLYIDSKDADGTAQNWNFEMGSLNALQKAGWAKDTVKMGDTVLVDGWLARSKAKPNVANMKSIRLPNGRELSGASSVGDADPGEKIEPKSTI